MKASLRWIGEFVDLPSTDPDVVAEALSNLGIEVEGIETVSAGFSGVVVAKVLEVNPHPNADKVRIATLDAGGAPIEVVCGAWNFEAGATVAYATVGAVLPGGFEISAKEVRGVMSPGMICSEIELGLGDEAGGILVLAEGYAAPGTDFASTLPYPDTILDVAITPNRPDAMSIYGLARDLGALYDVAVRHPEIDFDEAGTTAAMVRIEQPDRCRRFTAREVTGVTVAASPLWLRLRLRDAGQRPISNIVDITNYVMLEIGQPLHGFDLDRIADETIVVRLASDGEHLTTLDGVERVLSAEDLVIAGIDQPLGLAGVMGGGDSEVSAATTRVLIEVAHFDPAGVLLTGKRHGLRTEAVARFERGVDPDLPPVASARAATLAVQLAGGTVVGGFVDEHPRPPSAPTIELPAGEARRLLGVAIAPADQAGYLRRLGFEVEGEDPMRVTVPTHRVYDVSRRADLVEEIARIHGYDKIPSRLSVGRGGGLSPQELTHRRVRQVLAGAGYFEVLNFDWVARHGLDALGLDPDDVRLAPIRLRNPMNDEQEYLRTTLVPGLLGGLRRSAQRNRPDAALFEIGTVFLRGGADLPDQPKHLGFAATGRRSSSLLDASGSYGAADGVGLVEMLLETLGIDAGIEQAAVPGLHPGRGARIVVDGAPVGWVGEIDPDVAAAWDLTDPVIVGEMAMGAITLRPRSGFAPPSPYPPVVFDLAFDVADDTPVGAVVDAVRDGAGEDLERVEVFDVFRGAPLAPGRKSIGLRLSIRSRERTLTDEEVAPVRESIERLVAEAVGGVLRGG